jgi:hypothetical protein
MKNLILFILFTLSGIITMAQSDVIYPTENRASISNCKINNIEGNKVYYTKDSISELINATAVERNGVYSLIETMAKPDTASVTILYKGHDYEYYNKKYQRTNSLARSGTTLTMIGVVGIVAGTLMLKGDSDQNSAIGGLAFIGGSVLFNIGMPLLITNGIKASNNQYAMKKTKNKPSLSFGTTNNGIGLNLNF